MIYLQLFLSFFKIGILGFGGGMAIVSLIQTEVEHYGWMSATEYLDILAISQMTPGPIGINAATYVGYTASGTILGSLVATASIILPSLIIMMIISALYVRIKNRWSSNPVYQWTMIFIRAAVILLIAYACVKLIKPEAFIDGWSWILFSIVFLFTLIPQWAPKTKLVNFVSHPISLIVLCGLLGFCLYGCSPKSPEEKRCEQQVDSVMQTLSTRQKVAQLTMVSTTSYGDSAYQARITSLVADEGIGGLILMHDSLTRCREYLNGLQHMARVPMLIAIDGEWGPSMRFAEFPFFPRQMQLGALPDDSLVYEMGLAVGRQCREAGIHINFAPVVDVNNNPDNVAINTRSFGESRERVAQYGSAYMRGMQDAGIFACAKHFPGHGDTDVDSHKALPTLPFSRSRLDSLELYPFRRLIDDGVSMVMLAHLHIPALDTAVSSVSRPIVSGLLKKELGFKGVVVTDALVMKGVAEGREPAEVMEMAYAAGVDMLLMPGDAVAGIERITSAIEAGVYSKKDLDKRLRKVLMMKAKAGLLERPSLTDALAQSADHVGCATAAIANALPSAAYKDSADLVARVRSPKDSLLIEQIADRSLTLLKTDSSFLPLGKDGCRIAYVAYGADYQPLRRFYGEVEGLSGFGGGSGVLPSGSTVCFGQLAENYAEEMDYIPLSRALSAEDLRMELMRIARSYTRIVLAFHDPADRPHSELVPDSAHQAVFCAFASQQKAAKNGILTGAEMAVESALDPKAPAAHPELKSADGCFFPYCRIASVFFGNPYALRDYPWLADFDALLICYADTKPNERAAAEILLGRICPEGHLPVTSGAFPIGSGITLP